MDEPSTSVQPGSPGSCASPDRPARSPEARSRHPRLTHRLPPAESPDARPRARPRGLPARDVASLARRLVPRGRPREHRRALPPRGRREGWRQADRHRGRRRRRRARHGVAPRARRLRRDHPGEEPRHRRSLPLGVVRREGRGVPLRHRPVAHAAPRPLPRAVHRGGEEPARLHGHQTRRSRVPRALRRPHLLGSAVRHRTHARAAGRRRGGRRGAVHRLARQSAREFGLRRRRVHRERREQHSGLRGPATRRAAGARREPDRPALTPVQPDGQVLQKRKAPRAVLVPGAVRRFVPVQCPRRVFAARGDRAHGRRVVPHRRVRQGAPITAGAGGRGRRRHAAGRGGGADRHDSARRGRGVGDRGLEGDTKSHGRAARVRRGAERGRGGGEPRPALRLGPDDRPRHVPGGEERGGALGRRRLLVLGD